MMIQTSSLLKEKLSIDAGFPKRKAVVTLKARVVDCLVCGDVKAGDPFLTDSEIMELSGLSRSTVWRALDQLGREGWLDRQIGRGTFVGIRISMPDGTELAMQSGEYNTNAIRLGVCVFNAGQWAEDWFTPHVLQGIDDVVDSHEIRVELLGMQNKDPEIMSRRLAKSKYDVLACLSQDPGMALLIRDAQRLEIPTIAVDPVMAAIGSYTVCEDNAQGMQLAISHLVEYGHRRIGLVMQMHNQPWVMERYFGYMHAIEKAGIEFDAGLALLLETRQPHESEERVIENRIQRLEQYILKEKPTAIIVGHYYSMNWLLQVIRKLDMHVPQDLSIVGVDQKPWGNSLGDGVELTTVALPLEDMGKNIARMAGAIMRGGMMEKQVCLPCSLIEGNSVKNICSI